MGEIWILPESPRFLVRQGRIGDARESIRRLGNITDPAEVALFIHQVQLEMEDERQESLIQQVDLGARGIAPNTFSYVSYGTAS